MKKLLLVGTLLCFAIPLISMKVAPLSPAPDELLEELKMLGIQMVYQPRPINISHANSLLNKAEKKINLIKQIGSKEQVAKAKKILFGMLGMYQVHLRDQAEKQPGEVFTHPPMSLTPPPALQKIR